MEKIRRLGMAAHTFLSNLSLGRQRQTDRWYDGLALLFVALVVMLFLGKGLLPGRVWLPLDIVVEAWPPWQELDQPAPVHNLLLGDAVNYIYPVKEFAAEAVREGVLPLWNPYVMGGYPFTYNTQAGLFYPLSLFYYLLPGATAVNLTILTQLLLGAFFAYLYLRLICTRRLAALAGTILFLFNGMMVVWLSWQVVHAAMIWLPLQLYLAERMVRSLPLPHSPLPNPQPQSPILFALLTGMALAIPWLGGHWNWTLYSSMTLAAYLAWQLWPHFRQGQRQLAVGLVGLPLLVGLALSLVQIWPAAAYLTQSHRQPFSFADSLGYGLLNRGVVLLVPNFFGDPVSGNWWGHSNYNETTLYLGILPLFLSGLALWLRRDRVTLFFAGWGALGLLWALGTPLYGVLYILPIFGGLLPSRAATIVVVAVSFLAALAVDRLLAEDWNGGRLRQVVMGMAVAFLLVVGVYGFIYRIDTARTWAYLQPQLLLFLGLLSGSGLLLWARLQGWLSAVLFGNLVLGWLIVDLFIFGYTYNTVGMVEELYPETAVAQFLHTDPDLFRIVTLPVGTAYPPNSSLVPRLANISGYEPGILQRYLNYITLAEGGSPLYYERELMPLQGIGSPLLDSLNMKYVVTITDWWQADSTADIVQDRVTSWLSLAPGEVVEQTFAVADAGLHRLDLRLAVNDEFGGAVTAQILSADGLHEFAHASLHESDLGTEAWHTFYFGAFPSEWGREFLLRLTTTGAGVQVGTAETAVTPAAMLTINGRPQPGQLAFATYYLPRPHLLFEQGKTRIYLNETYFPRAFAVPEAVLVGGEAAALALLQQEIANLDRLVVLELEGQAPPPLSGPETAVSSAEFLSAAGVTITDYGLNQVRLTADLPQAGFVVLADSYYPGWRARVDGEETAVYRANSILRAVYLPAGRHEIEFYFRPLDFIWGAVFSGLTLLACCLVIGFNLRRRRQHMEPET
jgi:hypothetical protein